MGSSLYQITFFLNKKQTYISLFRKLEIRIPNGSYWQWMVSSQSAKTNRNKDKTTSIAATLFVNLEPKIPVRSSGDAMVWYLHVFFQLHTFVLRWNFNWRVCWLFNSRRLSLSHSVHFTWRYLQKYFQI